MPVTEGSSSTSASLLDRVRQLDPDAWDRLTRLYSPVVYRWCRHAGLQDNDAADVSQEAFRAVANGIQAFRRDRPGDSFRGWLWTITRNKIRDHFRRIAERPGAVGGSVANQQLLDIPDSTPDDDTDPTGFDVTGSLVHQTLELVQPEFEPRTWQAFLRVTIGGVSPSLVAEELGMNLSSVYTAKSRVLRRLREEMDGLI